MTDRFLEQILAGLEKDLDPKTFELCAVDLIRKEYPATVPVLGGQDSGMDGAIADFEGEAFPIICTTQGDVGNNLRNSLDSYLTNNGPRRKVISVTSQSLTPRRQENLKKIAREKGFELVQIYERQAIAERLRENPRWCKELLNLTGDLPVLTKLPPHSRSEFSVIELIGRQEDLTWLQTSNGDVIVTGQPGSGKTALMTAFSEAENSFFLAGSNESEITAAFRELKPEIIILDDAHAYTDRMDFLLRLRRDRKSTRLNSSHTDISRMPSSA